MSENLILIMPHNMGAHTQSLALMSNNHMMPLQSLSQQHQNQLQHNQQHYNYCNNNNNININNNNIMKTISKPPPLKPAKKLRNEEEDEMQRCKRRIHFGQLNSVMQGRHRSTSQLRRNERERNRVRMINMTFARLRQHIPDGYCKNKNKKLSKVDTLRGAIDYINGLQDLLDEDGSVSPPFEEVLIPHSLSSSGSSSSNSSVVDDKENIRRDSLSDGSSSPSSTEMTEECDDSRNRYGKEIPAIKQEVSSDFSNEGFSPEEEDLLDFSSWF